MCDSRVLCLLPESSTECKFSNSAQAIEQWCRQDSQNKSLPFPLLRPRPGHFEEPHCPQPVPLSCSPDVGEQLTKCCTSSHWPFVFERL